MIAHEHPGVNEPAGLCARFRKRLNEHQAIVIVFDNPFPPIASCGDMVDCIFELDSGLSCHRFIRPPRPFSVKNC